MLPWCRYVLAACLSSLSAAFLQAPRDIASGFLETRDDGEAKLQAALESWVLLSTVFPHFPFFHSLCSRGGCGCVWFSGGI